MTTLDEDTRDALAETFNIALGHAATQFAEMVQEEIELSLPMVALIPAADLVPRIEASPGLAVPARLCSIAQRFRSPAGDIQIQAVLLFSETGSLAMLRRMLGPDTIGTRMGELEGEALGEVGNVILNSCMNRLAEVFDRAMTGTLPQWRSGPAHELLAEVSATDRSVLWAGVGMRLADQQIDGQVVFVMDLASLRIVIQQVQRFFGMSTEPA
jgi:chemotaxis protein CheC